MFRKGHSKVNEGHLRQAYSSLEIYCHQYPLSKQNEKLLNIQLSTVRYIIIMWKKYHARLIVKLLIETVDKEKLFHREYYEITDGSVNNNT